MTELHAEELIAICLSEFRRKRDTGEPASPGEWRDRLGERYGEFLDALEVDAMLSELIEPVPAREELPRHFGEYLLLERVGGGAMGIVYEAVHQGLNRRVALKILRAGLEGDPEALERFLREARICAKAKHPNVVTIYDAGQTEGRPWYSMGLLPGRSLRDLIREDRVPPLTVLCAGLADVADALEALHRVGGVHRDVKPGNIVLDEMGKMVLADFGLARCDLYRSLTLSSQAMGTPLYMSPEQVPGCGNGVDARTDVYGLGATLYEAVAGRPPFRGASFEAILAQVVAARPTPLTTVPQAVNRIALKALEKRQADRYPSAAAMRDDLRAFAAGLPVVGRPVPPVCRALRRCRLALAAAAAVLLLTGVYWFLSSREPGYLFIESKLQAQIFVDGRMVGVSPVQVCLEPGEHEVEAVAPGMHSPPVQIVATRGHTERVVFSPVILNPDNRVVVDELERSMGQTPTDLDAPPRKRSGSVAGPLFPRGSVRLTDLRRFAIEFDDPVNVPEGEIRFLRGDEVLGVAVAPVSLGAGYGPLPDALVRALRPGDKVRWGFWAATGESPHGTAEFEVVDDPVVDFETRLAAVGAGQPPAALAHLRCDELLRQGLFTAAYEEAVRVTMSRPQSARAWRVRIEALDRMGADLSRLRAEELVSWDALPDEERERAMSHGRGSPR